jgi:ABC-type sugar transport system ATPase subunit
VRVAGAAVAALPGCRAALARGVALVPEDRKRQGLLLDLAVGDNLVLPSLGRLARRGWRAPRREAVLGRSAMRGVAIKASGSEQCVAELSGGNQQKVVLGKWLARDPSVLLLDEPTRGVDVAAKDEIHRLVEALADAGKAVLFASSEMEEVLALADRVLVLREGRLAGELRRADASEVAVMRLATEARAG